MIPVLSSSTKKRERESEENETDRICHSHPKKQALPDPMSSHPFSFTVIFVNKRLKLFSSTTSLGSSGAYAKKLRISGLSQ